MTGMKLKLIMRFGSFDGARKENPGWPEQRSRDF
jgi:hypothetical protein